MMRGVAILALACGAPAAAQQASAPPPAERAVAPNVTIVPAPPPGPSVWARAEKVKRVDIPQWAKDAGHNGYATYIATVDADGKLVALELKVSSRSEAIDAAVRARAETLAYQPATDKDGNPAAGPVIIRMGYARFDATSPGGGIATYTCGDLVREHDWYHVANSGYDLASFVPEDAYVLAGVNMLLAQPRKVDDAELDAEVARRRQMWGTLLDRCRKAPEMLMLEEVNHPEAFRQQIEKY